MAMTKSMTKQVARLLERTRELEATEEAFFCMRRGEMPTTLTSGERSVEVLGMGRASGGVVLNGPCIAWASDWCARVTGNYGDPYAQDIASQITRMQTQACAAEAEKKRWTTLQS